MSRLHLYQEWNIQPLWKVKGFFNRTSPTFTFTYAHTDTHTFTKMYLYMCVYICMFVYVCVFVFFCCAVPCHVACRALLVVGWGVGCGVVWCAVLLSTCRCRGGPCPWSFLLRMMSILQPARAERSMIERRVGQHMECVVFAPFSK